MKKADDDLRKEYKRSDFVALERGKFRNDVAEGMAVALLEPAVAKAFPTSDAVNEALKGLLAVAEQTARLTGLAGKPARRRTIAG